MNEPQTSSLDRRYPKPVYCLRCNEELYGRGEGRCEACGLTYDAADSETFAWRPVFRRWKFWLPGFCLSVLSGMISYAVCLQQGDLGAALFVAVPVSMGAILGYATRFNIWGVKLLVLAAIANVVLGLVSMSFAGFFCGMTLFIIFLVPAMIGATLGYVLRLLLERSRWDQRWFLPLIGFILLPYVVQAVESSLPQRRQIAEVRTALRVDATPEEAWNAILFYEQVEHEPPWLLDLALPQPVHSVGDKQTEGEVVRCFYDRGYLSKRISRVERGRRLAFEVVEQQLHFERDIKLLGGSFELTPLGDEETTIVLTTRYERLLAPRAVWEPLERHVVHTLHGHVLEGMRRKINTDRREMKPSEDPPESPAIQEAYPTLVMSPGQAAGKANGKLIAPGSYGLYGGGTIHAQRTITLRLPLKTADRCAITMANNQAPWRFTNGACDASVEPKVAPVSVPFAKSIGADSRVQRYLWSAAPARNQCQHDRHRPARIHDRRLHDDTTRRIASPDRLPRERGWLRGAGETSKGPIPIGH